MSKKRKIKPQGIDFENSTVFKKANRDESLTPEEVKLKKQKKTKRIIGVFLIIAILLVAVPWLVVNIITSPKDDYVNPGEPTQTFETLLNSTNATEQSTEVYNMKNPDLNDTDAVTALIAKLKPQEELGQYSVLVQATEKPYTITLKFDSTHDTTQNEDGNKWETEVVKYSTAIMALIDNVAQVNWEFPSGENKTEGSFFNRADAEKLMKLGVPVSQFAKSPEAVQLLLNQLGIDLY